MAVMTQYPTRPLDCWAKLQELRRTLIRETFTARDRGELVILGMGRLHSFLSGLGKFHIISPMPVGPDMKDLPLLVKYNDMAGSKGYSNDSCATLRIALGAMLMGRFALNTKTGQVLKPDLHFEALGCQGQMKAQQLYRQHWFDDLPSRVIEMPWQEEPRPGDKDYLVDQLNESVEWLEKVSGRKFDDERLAQGWLNEWRCRVYFSHIIEQQRAIPAPLDQRMLASFAVPLWRAALYRDDVVEWYQMALSEVKERVKDGISALGQETLRMMHEGPSPWYPSGIMRYPRRYGALFIGSWLYYSEFGNFRVNPDGSWEIAPLPEEAGVSFKSREDILRSMATIMVDWNTRPQVTGRVDQRLRLVQDYHVQGVVFALDRGCLGNVTGAMESMIALKEVGIPVAYYQTACANPAEFKEKEYQATIDTFLESVGLRPLEAGEGQAKEKEEEL